MVGRSVATLPALPTVAPPVRIQIPAADVDARIEPSGVTADGLMSLPPDPNVMGWYRFGPTPTDPTGSVVLGGHLDSRTYGVGQLVRLRDLSIGAEVIVSSAGGGATRYTVAEVQQIAKAALPVSELFRRDGSPVLVLITCGGDFDADRGGYEDNLVVTAHRA